MLRAGIRVTQTSAWERLQSMFVLFLYVSGLFQRWVSTDSVFISLHVLLACRPACRLRVCLGCYPQSASYQPTTFRQAAVGVRNRIACNAEVYQTNELLLCDRPDPCFLLCLHALGQYQTSELLLWDRPNYNFELRFTRSGPVSGY